MVLFQETDIYPLLYIGVEIKGEETINYWNLFCRFAVILN